MHETILSLEGLDLMAFLEKERQPARIESAFSQTSDRRRGTELKAMGDREDLGRFEEVMRMVIWHVDRYNAIAEDDIDRLVKSEEASLLKAAGQDDVIVYGPGGLKVTARTPNQRRLVEAIRDHDMVFAVGPAGSGKTYTAVAMAVAALKDRRVKIIPTCPAEAKTSASSRRLEGETRPLPATVVRRPDRHAAIRARGRSHGKGRD